MGKRKVVALFTVLIFIIMFSAGCGGDATVISRVNGEKILQSDLDDKIAQIKSGLTSQGYTFQGGEQDKEILEQIATEAMNQLTEEALLMQQASEAGVSVEDSAVKEQLNLIKQQYGADVFEQLLSQQQLTEAKLSEMLKVQLTKQALFEKLTADISVDEKAAKAAYTADPKKYEEIQVAHILVAADASATEDQVKAAQKKAEGVIAKLKAGEDFAALCKTNSDDPQTAETGGVLDTFFTREDTSLVKEFVDGAFKVGEGQFSQQPVRTEYGFHIIKVLEKKDSFAELKDAIQGKLLSDKKNEAFNKYFNDAKSKAKIEDLR